MLSGALTQPRVGVWKTPYRYSVNSLNHHARAGGLARRGFGPWTVDLAPKASGFETTQLYSRTGFLNSRAEFYNARTGFFKTQY